VATVCDVTVDLKRVPRRAFEKKVNQYNAEYYTLPYQIAMVFGYSLEFQFLWNGRVLGAAVVKYD
jgi:hypothetical protein